jgi:hypothetical protein
MSALRPRDLAIGKGHRDLVFAARFGEGMRTVKDLEERKRQAEIERLTTALKRKGALDDALALTAERVRLVEATVDLQQATNDQRQRKS